MSGFSGFDRWSQEGGLLPVVNHFLYRQKLKELLLKQLPVPDGQVKLRQAGGLGGGSFEAQWSPRHP